MLVASGKMTVGSNKKRKWTGRSFRLYLDVWQWMLLRGRSMFGEWWHNEGTHLCNSSTLTACWRIVNSKFCVCCSIFCMCTIDAYISFLCMCYWDVLFQDRHRDVGMVYVLLDNRFLNIPCYSSSCALAAYLWSLVWAWASSSNVGFGIFISAFLCDQVHISTNARRRVDCFHSAKS